MNTMPLSAALILSLTLFAPSMAAQSKGDPGQPVVESPEPIAKKIPPAGKLEKPVSTVKPVVEPPEPIAKKIPPVGKLEKPIAAVKEEVEALRIDVQPLEHGGIRLDIAKADEAGDHLFLVIFAGVCNAEMVPIAVLDASTQDMRSFAVELDMFAVLPIGLLAVRVGSDGVTQEGRLETAATIAGRSH